jgi:hypothetical protein
MPALPLPQPAPMDAWISNLRNFFIFWSVLVEMFIIVRGRSQIRAIVKNTSIIIIIIIIIISIIILFNSIRTTIKTCTIEHSLICQLHP